MCLKQVPDIILSDVQMPRLDGWQLLRLIRARPALACVPVIFLTSLDSEAERLRGYRLGVDGYIPKPYTPEELLVRVHQILRRVGQAAARGVQQTPLRGDLEHVALGSLLSFLEVEKKSGILLVVGAQVARLFVADGRLLRAEIESSTHDQNSTEVLEQALTWASGQFEFLPQAVPEASDFGDDSITSLLIEHARKSDEFKQGR
jgi:CheY-like chemotaxis protein